MQALTYYAYNARLRDITKMTLSIELTADPENVWTEDLGRSGISQLHTIPVSTPHTAVI